MLKPKEVTHKVTIDIEIKLLEAIKKISKQKGRTIREIVESGMQDFLDDVAKGKV